MELTETENIEQIKNSLRSRLQQVKFDLGIKLSISSSYTVYTMKTFIDTANILLSLLCDDFLIFSFNYMNNFFLLGNFMNQLISKTGVNNLIRHVVKEFCSSSTKEGNAENIEPEEIIKELYNKGIMKTILENVQWSDNFEREIKEKIQNNLKERIENPKENNEGISNSKKERALDDEEELIDSNREENSQDSDETLDKDKKDQNNISGENDEIDKYKMSNLERGEPQENYAEIVNEIPHKERYKGLLSKEICLIITDN